MIEKKVAWITGSGAPRVGQVIAKYFAAKGFRIALHANSSIDSATECALEMQQSGTEAIQQQIQDIQARTVLFEKRVRSEEHTSEHQSR